MLHSTENIKYGSHWNYPKISHPTKPMQSFTGLAVHNNWGRIFIEILFYLSITARVFGQQLGVIDITGLSGAIIVASGFVCMVVMISHQEHFPPSLIFVLLINLIANTTDLFYVGLFTRDMLYWMSILLMACYIVRDFQAALRLQFFLTLTVFFSIYIGAEFIGQAQGYKRMALRADIVGSMFADPNDLSQLSLMTATALLFSSLCVKSVIKVLCWGGAIALSIVVLLTLSRQGLFMLGAGWALFLLTITLKQGNKISLIALIVLVLAVSGLFIDELASIIKGYEYRLGLSSDRIIYWKTAPQDMMNTLFSGNGTFNSFSSVGIKPHSSFLWLHFAYGGLCAWTFVAWLIYLAIKTLMVMSGEQTELSVKIEIFTMFSLFFLGQFTTVFAAGNYGFILGVALMERQFHRANNDVPVAGMASPQTTTD